MRARLNIMCRMALCAAVLCLMSPWALPLGGVPVTLSLFAVLLISMLFPWRIVLGAVLVYICLGAVGLPVFAGFGGSLAFLVGPTGGFLVGFPLLALFCGIAAKRKHLFGEVLFILMGLMFCHLLGVLWFSYVSAVSLAHAFMLTSLPYVIKDVIFVLLARLLVRKLSKRSAGLAFFRKQT